MVSQEPPSDERGARSTAFDVDLTADDIVIEVHQRAEGCTLRVDEGGSPECGSLDRREMEAATTTAAGPPRWLGTVIGKLARGLLLR